ncbi:MAG TPA: hypothetical protein VJB92_03040 [Candidatus Paceibacterota bacterium]
MTWDILIKLTHLLGTVLGVGGATFAEIFYLKSLRSGTINETTGDFLKTTYRILRIGMIILIISGFSYLIVNRLEGHAERLYSPRLWSKLTITAILLLGVVAWQAKKIPIWLGSAVSLTSWWAALILGAWRGLGATYLEIIVAYFLLVALMGIALSLIRKTLGVSHNPKT